MTFIVHRSDKHQPVSLPAPILALSELAEEDALEFTASEHLTVVTPARMTAMEVMSVIDTLNTMIIALTVELLMECGVCDECGTCAYEESINEIRLPPHIMEAAGLPLESRLEACVDEDGTIIVKEADLADDLSAIVPQVVMEALLHGNACMLELESILQEAVVVHNGTKNRSDEDRLCEACRDLSRPQG